MWKKTKITLILFLMLGIILMPLKNVNAHSVELDPNSLIRFPIIISNGKGNITIKSSETGYSLYYQAVEISNAIYTQIEKTKSDGETAINSIKEEMDELNQECDDLKTIYNEAYEAYKEKLDSGVTDAELESLKTTYETTRTNYQNKVTEYNNKVAEYNAKVDEVNAKVKELTPTYVESNWIKTEDGSFSVDLSQFSGDKAFAIWAKLVSSDGTISYDEATYTMSGTKAEDVKVEGISLDKTTLTLTAGSSYTLTATINPSDATDKQITWTSDNEDVATVSNGIITAKASGTVMIKATTKDGNYTATCNVTVSEKLDTDKEDSSTDTKKDTDETDATVANGKLPQTGVSMTIVVSILAMVLVAIISYKSYYKYKDLK